VTLLHFMFKFAESEVRESFIIHWLFLTFIILLKLIKGKGVTAIPKK